MDIFCFSIGIYETSQKYEVDLIQQGFNYLYQDQLGLPPPLIESQPIGKGFLVAGHSSNSGKNEVQLFEDEVFSLLIFGELDLTESEALSVWHRKQPLEGMEFFLASEGCFGALLYNKQNGDFRLFSDFIGQRTLRYCLTDNGSLLVSSHDIGLVLMGGVDAATDPVSYASIRKIGWSLDEGSILKGINVCQPYELTLIQSSSNWSSAEDKPTLRVEPISEPEMASKISVQEAALEALAKRADRSSNIIVELSAGFDSRACFSATLAISDATRIVAFSEGAADSQDVLVAAKVAQLAGVQFVHHETSAPSMADFIKSWSQAATATNGHIATSVLASRQTKKPGTNDDLIVCGDGGDFYRGTYYPYRPFSNLIGRPLINPEAALRKRFNLHDQVNCQQDELIKRLQTSLKRITPFSPSTGGALDRFYARERFAVWNQKLTRDPGVSNRFSPFFSRRAAMAAFQLENPISWSSQLHYDLVHQYHPRALNLPINGGPAANLYALGKTNEMLKEASLLASKVNSRIRHKLGLRKNEVELSRSQVLAEILENLQLESNITLYLDNDTSHTEEVNELFKVPNSNKFWELLGSLRFIRICESISHFRKKRCLAS